MTAHPRTRIFTSDLTTSTDLNKTTALYCTTSDNPSSADHITADLPLRLHEGRRFLPEGTDPHHAAMFKGLRTFKHPDGGLMTSKRLIRHWREDRANPSGHLPGSGPPSAAGDC